MKNTFIKIIACLIILFIVSLPIAGTIKFINKQNSNTNITTVTITELESFNTSAESKTETTTIQREETSTEKEETSTVIKESTSSIKATTEKNTSTTEKITVTEKQTTTSHVEDKTEPVAQTISIDNNYLGKMYITGYTAEEGFPEGSATASGYGVRSGYCALNNSQRKSLGLKYGDKIYVEGLGTYTVMDCGCAWGVVDIWVYTNAEAYAITGYYNVYIV